jgi:glycosyltransferase involved in cell wall biosynthesis
LDQRAPLVTIGMPTFNGARFLAQSLDSLLAQDYRNLELVISDNCSTDETEKIARDYARRYGRIRYLRNETNLGVAANFNRVLSEASGTYYMWAADHDLWDPVLVSRCVEALEANPAAVLAYPGSLLIDEAGAVVEEMDDQIDLDSPSALTRYKRLIWRLTVSNMIYGVARRDSLAATGGFAEVHGADHAVLAGLALRGRIIRVGGHLYLRRQNRPPEAPAEHRARALTDLNPAKAPERVSLSTGRLYRGLRDQHIKAVKESSLTARQKLDAILATLDCFQQRFEVRSFPMSLLRTGARCLRLRGRLDGHFGKGA